MRKRSNYKDDFSRMDDAGAIVRTGMPQATNHERRAMRAQYRQLQERVAASAPVSVFVKSPLSKKKRTR